MPRRKLSGLTRLNMEILDYRYAQLDARWNAADISSPFSRVYLVTEGTGYLRCGDRVITMTPGNIYVVPAGLRFSYWCDGSFQKVYFHISVPLPSGYDLLEDIGTCVSFPAPETVAFVEEKLHSEQLADIMRIKAELYGILSRCLEGDTQQISGTYSEAVAGAMAYIQENLSAALDTDSVAKALGVSAEKLRKTFRTEVGVPVGKYIRDRVLNRAELEIRRGEFSVKEISERLGFSDQFYFSRCFSDKFGLSPVKYRKKIKPEQ